jgi:molecular chaperone DnaK (HSP70)
MERIFGIDLGTTNSVIAYTDPAGTTEVIAGTDGNRILPSVIYFGKDGSQLVGNSARQRAVIEPERAWATACSSTTAPRSWSTGRPGRRKSSRRSC